MRVLMLIENVWQLFDYVHMNEVKNILGITFS